MPARVDLKMGDENIEFGGPSEDLDYEERFKNEYMLYLKNRK